ncbi:MAG: DUF2066 domain-containing protein [Alphaproteobacteria bacterium]
MLITLCFFALPQAWAANPLFTVENVTVDVSAENALKAREKAFEQAQVKAFEQLTTRMLSESQLQAFRPPAPETISILIQDYEVSNEKLSSKRYIGTYKFRFKDRDVKRFFSGQGASYTDVASQPLLILPFLDTGEGTLLWSHQNAWMKAWASAPNLSGGLVPMLVPLGDLSDVSDIGDDEALTYSKRRLSAMLERYGASEAVIAIARPEGTALNIQLYRTDRARPEYVHQILERALPGQASGEIYTRAVQSVKAALRKDWKQKTIVDSRAHGTIRVRAQFASLQEWSGLERALSRVSGISDITLTALSPRQAYLDLTYDGNMERLKIALAQSGLVLNAPRFQPASENGLNADYSRGLLERYGKNEGESVIYDLTRTSAAAPSSSRSGPGYRPPAAPPGESYQTRF